MNIEDIAHELRTQDGRATSHPMFQVRTLTYEVLQTFFTNASAQAFIDTQAYPEEELHIYVASGHRNAEYQLIRDFLISMPTTPTPSPSEILYGFASWLTTREEVTTMSRVHDSAPIASLVHDYCQANELASPRDDWHLQGLKSPS